MSYDAYRERNEWCSSRYGLLYEELCERGSARKRGVAILWLECAADGRCKFQA